MATLSDGAGAYTEVAPDALSADKEGGMTTTTKKATHTPGPWGFGYLEHNRYAVVIAAQGFGDVALCARNSATKSCKGISMDEAKANARLIAAAPEMLEALELAEMRIYDLIIRTRKQCEYVDSLDGEGATEELRRYIRLSETAEKDIKAAIRKARGTE